MEHILIHSGQGLLRGQWCFIEEGEVADAVILDQKTTLIWKFDDVQI